MSRWQTESHDDDSITLTTEDGLRVHFGGKTWKEHRALAHVLCKYLEGKHELDNFARAAKQLADRAQALAATTEPLANAAEELRETMAFRTFRRDE